MTGFLRSYDLQNYVVLFLDVQGQKEKILEFQLVPNDEVKAKQTVLATAGHVDELRDRIHIVLEKQRGDTAFSRALPPEEREQLRKLTKSEVVFQTLSDALVLSVPIGDLDEQSTPTNGIRWALTACCWVQLTSLAEGHPIRGGLEIGWGVKLASSEIYGAALVRAYQIESSLAGYPRVVCGREVQAYLDWVGQQNLSSDLGRNAVETARHCKGYLFRDNDGLTVVDFLGAAFHEGASKVPNIEELVERASRFVEEELKRFTIEGEKTLATKYERLAEDVRARAE